jgi:hypothetical protein
LLQWLASLGCFAYPTNIISRFYQAPYIGAKIQKVLAEYDFKGEIFDPSYGKAFHSDLGKTQGPLAPHEFWYFWRRFFNYGEIQKLEQNELKQIDAGTIHAEVAALEHELQKPLVFKGMMFNWNIEFLDSIFEKALFIHLKRNPVYNMDSIFYARQNFFGSTEKWYSFKPPEYSKLKSKEPLAQVAGQVVYTNKYIAEQFKRVNPDKTLTVDYEALCSEPRKIYRMISEKYSKQEYELPEKYSGARKFDMKSCIRMIDAIQAKEECRKIGAHRRLVGKISYPT